TLAQLDDLVCREPNTQAYMSSLGIDSRVEYDSILEADFNNEECLSESIEGKILVTDYHPLREGDVGMALNGLLGHNNVVYYPLEHPVSFQDWKHALSVFKSASLVVTG